MKALLVRAPKLRTSAGALAPALALALLPLGVLGACQSPPPPPGALSLTGEPLPSLGPDGLALEWMEKEGEAALAAWNYRPTELNAVWVGRRLAYMGRFPEAIQWFASALETFPESYRLRRHMGHRLLTIREIDAAIAILGEAKALAADAPNRLEPDGAPGPEAEPRSTTHGNIDYHLALGHYLKGEFGRAADLWLGCARDWARNDDARVAAIHWAYVSLVREGRRTEAEAALGMVGAEPDVIENVAYADLVALYRGEARLVDLLARADRNAALDYGLARWMLANGDEADGAALLEDLGRRPGWTAFGVLAAEADLAAPLRESR